jgi:predicted nucleic acid-binding protein
VRLAIDTNAYRLMMDGEAEAVRLARLAERLLMPVPVLAELRYGFLNGKKGRENEANLVRFLDRPRVEILCCDEETAVRYAELKLQLKRQGTPIPLNDVWIAALVLQHQATLFTRDTDFERIPQLARV